jgi:kinesin family protein 4/21/27
MSATVNSRVQAVVRVRPLLPREVAAGGLYTGRGAAGKAIPSSIRLSANRKQVAVMGADKVFSFDNVFDEAASQEEVFNSTVRSLVEGCLNGYNATVLACM